MDGDVLTIDVQKAEGTEAEAEQDGVKCAQALTLIVTLTRNLTAP